MCSYPGSAGTRGTRRSHRRFAGALAATALLSIGFAVPQTIRAEEARPAEPTADSPRIPLVSTQGAPTRIEGKIVRSSRGKRGPVRLLVERKAASEPVTVLVAPEDVCDRLGLSLKAGEDVVIDGTMLKSERAILIANAFTIEGKTVRIRDADGKMIDPAGGPTGDKAVMSAGKPAPSAAP